ncbi:SseB family protein [Parablautia sp. Marseille-Q6255]|uniref:SseB family protein n=1 Tax=Parablautia sp. Marseille-Q6255 TaxID=3039593 RepID=UPI0024BC6962|nr:SseB family protein [Parablautia sp. Marseille-Q6255]
MEQDRKLAGNEKIETAIHALQKEMTDEMLAHTLTVIRKRAKENGHVIVSLDPLAGQDSLQMRVLCTDDGKRWFTAYTSFEEQSKDKNGVMSAFTAELGKIFRITLDADGIEGLILNPYHCTLMLNRQLIRIILGETAANE